MSLNGRPWDGRRRVRMFQYFGSWDNPSQREACEREELRLYALEEFDQLRRSDSRRATIGLETKCR